MAERGTKNNGFKIPKKRKIEIHDIGNEKIVENEQMDVGNESEDALSEAGSQCDGPSRNSSRMSSGSGRSILDGSVNLDITLDEESLLKSPEPTDEREEDDGAVRAEHIEPFDTSLFDRLFEEEDGEKTSLSAIKPGTATEAAQRLLVQWVFKNSQTLKGMKTVVDSVHEKIIVDHACTSSGITAMMKSDRNWRNDLTKAVLQKVDECFTELEKNIQWKISNEITMAVKCFRNDNSQSIAQPPILPSQGPLLGEGTRQIDCNFDDDKGFPGKNGVKITETGPPEKTKLHKRQPRRNQRTHGSHRDQQKAPEKIPRVRTTENKYKPGQGRETQSGAASQRAETLKFNKAACMFCARQGHLSRDCQKVSSYNERKQKCVEMQSCVKCGRRHPGICRLPREKWSRCDHCQGLHPDYLCQLYC